MSCWAEPYELYKDVKSEDLYNDVKDSLSEFTKRTGIQAKIGTLMDSYPHGADTFDVWIDGCGALAFTICNYHHAVTVENFCDLSPCRTAVKMIYKLLWGKYDRD